jgi:hypothetical protein
VSAGSSSCTRSPSATVASSIAMRLPFSDARGRRNGDWRHRYASFHSLFWFDW